MTPDSDRPKLLRPRRSGGFAWPDLLVILAAAAILVIFLSLGLSLSRQRAGISFCQDNARRLVAAWALYARDHRERCVNNYDPALVLADLKSGRLRNWANNEMTWGASKSIKDESNTNVAWMENGALHSYTGNAGRLFKCPADVSLSDRQKAAGWRERLRSVSMNAYVGPYSDTPADAGAAPNPFDPAMAQFLTVAGLPQPAMTFVTLEENANSINDGWYLNTRGSAKGWNDVPASRHNRGGILSFADGHVELHHWLGGWVEDPLVKRTPNKAYESNAILFQDEASRRDFEWLWARTSVPFLPPRAPR